MGQRPETETFLFTDIEGSTALLVRLGSDRYAEALAEHDRLIREAVASNGGTEVGTRGDSFFATFDSPSACASAAIAIQRSMSTTSWPGGEQVRVRIGLHSGEATETTSGPVGVSVHRAARVAAAAHGGQIVVSETATVLLRDADIDGLSLQDLGLHRLKDFGRPEHLFQIHAEGLESQFPPLHTLSNPELGHNLPVQLTSFVGREQELAEIHGIVEQSRLVTLSGPGGSGKTRLALQVATDRLEATEDGVWLADLSPLNTEEQVYREVARVLGVREESGRPLVETLLESLHYRNLLLILDNGEHVVDACAKLADNILQRCEHVWLIVTSREPLAVSGERVYRVPPMSLPGDSTIEVDLHTIASFEAIRLFIERSTEHRPDFALDATNVETVVSLCRHLDGIPLALELAAARMRSMSLEAVERHLEQRFRLLSSRSRTGSARQQTLEGAIAWSYELLNNEEKLVLGALSVFPSSFDLSAAESVCSKAAVIDALSVVDLLESLVDKSLVQTEQGARDLRYRLLESIAQYVTVRTVDLDTNVLERAQETHAMHYLDFTEAAAPHLQQTEQGEWMARISEDYENVRTALSYLATRQGYGVQALRMVASLRVFWWANLGGGAPGEARELANSALSHPESKESTAVRSGALLSLGLIEDMLGEAESARSAHEEGLLLARAVEDDRLVAEHLCQLSFAHYRLGQYEQGRIAAEEALRIVDERRNPHTKALAHDRLLLIEFSEQHYDAARMHAAEAIRLHASAGDRWRLGLTHNNSAQTEILDGDLVAARAALETALNEAFLPGVRSFALENLGFVSLAEGLTDEAAAEFHECMRQLVRIGLFVIAPYVLLGLAICASASDEMGKAAMLHGAADSILEAQGRPYEPVEASLREPDLDALRRRMGDQAFDDAYNRGHALKRPEAISFALGSGDRFGVSKQ